MMSIIKYDDKEFLNIAFLFLLRFCKYNLPVGEKLCILSQTKRIAKQATK